MGDPGSIPGPGRSPGEGNGNALQYSCLENPMVPTMVGYSQGGHKGSEITERLTLYGGERLVPLLKIPQLTLKPVC